MLLIDLNYHANNEYTDPAKVINDHWPSLGYVALLKKTVDIEVIKHINYEGNTILHDIRFRFFKSRNRFWHIPFSTHRYIKQQKPRFVMVQGFVFPLQLIFLKLKLGKGCIICLQHHGERPFKGLKGIVQKFADRFVDAYSFASAAMATDWIRAGVISSMDKCFEIMGVSTSFNSVDKMEARKKTGVAGAPVFIWVGRLNSNKDPLTVLAAFKEYLKVNAHARLYMIYQQYDLENEVTNIVHKSELLLNAVKLLGSIPHAALSYWFSAADFYISGSHREGSGYALIEAMACGCIPLVTAIPSFSKITNSGNCGLLYEPGNPASLLQAFIQSATIDLTTERNKSLEQFQNKLSFEAYAKQVQLMTESF